MWSERESVWGRDISFFIACFVYSFLLHALQWWDITCCKWLTSRRYLKVLNKISLCHVGRSDYLITYKRCLRFHGYSGDSSIFLLHDWLPRIQQVVTKYSSYKSRSAVVRSSCIQQLLVANLAWYGIWILKAFSAEFFKLTQLSLL